MPRSHVDPGGLVENDADATELPSSVNNKVTEALPSSARPCYRHHAGSRPRSSDGAESPSTGNPPRPPCRRHPNSRHLRRMTPSTELPASRNVAEALPSPHQIIVIIGDRRSSRGSTSSKRYQVLAN
uniref:Uncharacterized protein n=1 Tax=Oryza punctata TaxID=4537 RepID=A0A0E0M101_ORYPU